VTVAGIDMADVCVTIEGAPIVRNVSLCAVPGEWLAVVGPNGAGKSTLLRAIASVVSFTGTITVDGRDVGRLRPRERARLLAMVVQTPLVPIGSTVVEYVALGRTPHVPLFGVESERDHDAIAAALHRLDLVPFAHRPIETLSGGERQRVLLARALAQDAPVLLLDEPTTALDLGHQQQVLELVDELRHERELVVVTSLHDLSLAAQFAHRVAVLDRGSIVADGAPVEVLTTELLSKVFGATVRVIRDEHGLTIAAMRPPRSSTSRGGRSSS
jgi:iron complex transport system ATP-binding protein